jgi:amidase
MKPLRTNRRMFVATAGALLASAAFPSRVPRAIASPARFDSSFGTATEALAALGRGVISSRELTEHVFARIKKHNARINAFVTLLEEQALAHAREADEQRARKRNTGPLHGLPVLIKDTFQTAGVRTTSGSRTLANHVPGQDAVVVARLKQAGAILIGKTNTPEFAGDVQTYNDVAGTTHNPWDITRTPGGSTGGGAAALAAGLGFLEVGSDIAGSIRIPAGFCGVYGHKPTLDIVPREGHIPPPLHVPHGPEILPVAGPLARSASDLILELGVLAGPAGDDARALRWSLPAPRRKSMREYKVGVVLDDPYCPPEPEVLRVLEEAVTALRKAGAQVTQGWPRGFDAAASHENYLFLLGATMAQGMPEPQIEAIRKAVQSGATDSYLLGATATHQQWVMQNRLRLRTQNLWRDYFNSFDVFLCPVTFTAAFPHDHSPDLPARMIATSSGPRPYVDLYKWISPATLTGCPATAIPVGRTAGGLPVSIQAIGPYMEDGTPLDFAVRMAEIIGGFTPPPGFA